MPSCSCRVMLTNLGGHPSRARHAHRASLFTESNALVRSINARQRSRPCSLHFSCTCWAEKIMSVVPRPGLKPHCVSGIIWYVTNLKNHKILQQSQTKRWPEMYVSTGWISQITPTKPRPQIPLGNPPYHTGNKSWKNLNRKI